MISTIIVLNKYNVRSMISQKCILSFQRRESTLAATNEDSDSD